MARLRDKCYADIEGCEASVCETYAAWFARTDVLVIYAAAQAFLVTWAIWERHVFSKEPVSFLRSAFYGARSKQED